MPEEDLVLRLSPLPLPELDEVDAATRTRFEREILPLWVAYLKEHARPSDEPTDFEIFVEQVARLQAALQYYTPDKIWLYWVGHPATNLETGRTRPRQDLVDAGAREYGIIHRHDHSVGELNRQQALAEAYAHYDTFTRHSHRRTVLAGFNPDDPNCVDMVDALQDLQSQGVERAFVKTSVAKYAANFVPLNSNDYEYLRAEVFEAFDWALIHFEGKSDAFLVQEAIDMQYEYRFFITDGHIVTGAGCVEEHTPLQNSTQFDPYMRRYRHDPQDPVVIQRGLVQQYREFADLVVRQLAAEIPELHDYVLDVTLTQDGPAIVELNGLANAGLYAADPARIVEAIVLA